MQAFRRSPCTQRFTRALAALEAHHANELHTQTRIANEARQQGDAALAQAAVVRHASSAQEAKLACQVQGLRCEVARQERIAEEQGARCAAAIGRAEAAEARARTSEVVLASELWQAELEHANAAHLLADFARAHEVKTEHLLSLQQQTTRSSALVARMQEQATSMQKRLAAQQRKTMRLQESQHLLDGALLRYTPWLHGCLAAWLPGCLAAWLPGCMAAWLHGCMAAWLHGLSPRGPAATP